MRFQRPHTHACQTCGDHYVCPGFWEENHDGIPEVICTAWHERGERECEDCYKAEACAYCGKKHVQLVSDSYGDRMCAECLVPTAVTT